VRILYFTRDYTPHDHRFLTSLAESGQEVYYLRLERSGRQLEDRPLPSSVQQVAWKGGQKPFHWRDLPGLVLNLRAILRQVQPDLVHAGPVQTVAWIAALAGARPLVTMSWGSDLLKDAERSLAYRWITRCTLARSDVLVGDCQAVQEKALQFGFPEQRCFIFPWGIDLQRFAPRNAAPEPVEYDLRTRLGWQDQFVVLSLRSWEPVYGIDVMLRGFALAAEEAPELRLLLLGGGSLAGMVQQMIEAHGLRDRVYLGGQVTQAGLPDIYRAADLYVSASHSDGSSVSLMEALGSGLPVLVTDIPSNREWVTAPPGELEGDQGWLFPDSDDQALAKGILNALRQPARLAEKRRLARERALERADWKKNFQVLKRAYQWAVENSPQDKVHEPV
jgi:glycosyltransferase involved in cell wall biosynthesis